jgi:hypothetical protein
MEKGGRSPLKKPKIKKGTEREREKENTQRVGDINYKEIG